MKAQNQPAPVTSKTPTVSLKLIYDTLALLQIIGLQKYQITFIKIITKCCNLWYIMNGHFLGNITFLEKK